MRSFLKWAGGKYRLRERIRAALPPGNRLIEPFVGSGAIFLNTDYPSYLLCDINPDLIALFRYLQTQGPAFIAKVESLFTDENNQEAAFYAFRDEFNSTDSSERKAALFIYLNRHAYNGLCRYNAQGGYNVPFGRYKRPYFPKKEMLAFHKKSQLAEFRCFSFKDAFAAAETGDVIYCDPPYVPLSASANFTDYSKEPFGLVEQKALAEMAKQIAKQKAVTVVISNHATDFTVKVYASAEIERFPVQRLISCKGEKREAANELLAVFS